MLVGVIVIDLQRNAEACDFLIRITSTACAEHEHESGTFSLSATVTNHGSPPRTGTYLKA